MLNNLFEGFPDSSVLLSVINLRSKEKGEKKRKNSNKRTHRNTSIYKVGKRRVLI